MKLICVKHFPEAKFSLYFLIQRLPEGESVPADPEAEEAWGIMKRVHDPGASACRLIVMERLGLGLGWVCVFLRLCFSFVLLCTRSIDLPAHPLPTSHTPTSAGAHPQPRHRERPRLLVPQRQHGAAWLRPHGLPLR